MTSCLLFDLLLSLNKFKQWRYVVLHVEISKALKRKFDSSSGKEIEPNYGKDKKVSTGYLMSSYSKSDLHECIFTIKIEMFGKVF